MKVGIFGGSFDPIHNGHIRLAQYVLAHTDLDQLWLMVSPRNPLKEHGPIATDAQRLEMARLAVAGIPGIEVSDFEFHLPIPSYTYKTLSELHKNYPEHQFRLIIGGDNWTNFHKWRNPEEIISQFGLIIYPRPGEILTPTNDNLHLTTNNPQLTTNNQQPTTNNQQPITNNLQLLTSAPQMPVSSTQIRDIIQSIPTEKLELAMDNAELKVLLPKEVISYIINQSIYS